MRQEASLKEWKRLYELAQDFIELKPWEYMYNEEYVCIAPENRERAYFTVMGNGGWEFGFGLYPSDNAFQAAKLLYSDPYMDQYLMFLQDSIMMYLDKKNEVSPDELRIMDELGLDFGEGPNWIIFRRSEPGFCLYDLDAEEVGLCIFYLERLIQAVKLIPDVTPRGKHIYDSEYIYAEENGEWRLSIHKSPASPSLPINPMNLSPDVESKLKNIPRTKEIWEIDIFDLGARVDDDKYDKTLFPSMLLVINHKGGDFIHKKMLLPDDNFVSVCEELISLMQKTCVPRKIIVQGPVMREGIRSLTSFFGITMEINELSYLNDFSDRLVYDMSQGEAFPVNGFEERGDPALNGDFHDEILIKLLSDSIKDLAALPKAEREKLVEELMKNPFIRSSLDTEEANAFFNGNPQSDIKDLPRAWEWEGEPVSDNSRTMRSKLSLIEGFYDETEPWSGESSNGDFDEEDWESDLFNGEICAEWAESWPDILNECSKKALLQLSRDCGFEANSRQKKEEIVKSVSSFLEKNTKTVLSSLSAEELKLIRDARNLINKKSVMYSQEFSHSKETLRALVEKGIIDIKHSHTKYTKYLTLLLPKKLKGVRISV